MYKVLIVDDESIIVEGLLKVVSWEKYDCKVVATAFDVKEATEMVRNHKPDIMVTDIRMPDGDGLTMLAGLRTEFPDMQVTVLTGHREFNYAQQAIQLGVTRFLLKPSRMDDLEEALQAMTDALKKAGINKSLERSEHTEGQELPEPIEEEKTDVAGSFIVRQAISFIEDNCTERISLQDVADSCYVSQWHLSKLLKKHTEQNFYELLNRARIAKAKKLMEDPALRIGDIAAEVGYTDTPHFSRVFKKLEGISANDYRNMGRHNTK